MTGLTCCVFTLVDVRGEDNEMATENAVAALGKVLEFHGSMIEGSAAAQSWDVWINSLPLLEDKVEARHVHAQLVRHIQASDARCALLPIRDCAASLHAAIERSMPLCGKKSIMAYCCVE